MDAPSLYQYLEREFAGKLYRSELQNGVAFYWERKRVNPSSRLIRITERADGGIAEIKLAQSSLPGPDVIMPLPVTYDGVAQAMRSELRKLQSDEAQRSFSP